jgi:hypothetical protein
MTTSLLTIWIGQVLKHFEIEFTFHPAEEQVKDYHNVHF